jgi:hypothetical protein
VPVREGSYTFQVFLHLETKEKVFFFEKKKQKTFMSLGWCLRKVRDSDQKFFGSFFQKRTAFFLQITE